MPTREQICRTTSEKLLAAAAGLNSIRATVGLDGFVDEIIAVVDKRHDPLRYEPVRTIEQMGRKIIQAAGQSSNYELVVKQKKLGGNGPIMANALAALGLDVTYIGSLGYPQIDPVFAELVRRARVISIAEAGHTDALEFDDGKLMLGKYAGLSELTWENLIHRVGRQRLKQLLDGSRLIGLVNWTMLPHMSDIWARLQEEFFPAGPRHAGKLFVDLADPEKRTRQDIMQAMQLLTRFQEKIDVVLGLNLKESMEIAQTLGLEVGSDPEASIEHNARAIRQRLNLWCVVIHPRRGAAAAREDRCASFSGPFVQHPKISTGAGDHFNAGFCLASVLGFSLEECLCAGCAASGYYVRTASSPTADELARFVAELPPPQS